MIKYGHNRTDDTETCFDRSLLKRLRFFQQNVCNNKKKICEQIYKRKLNRQGWMTSE